MNTENTFRAIVETAPVATMLVDSNGKISYVNHYAEELFEYKKEELIGNKIEILVPERFRHIHLKNRTRYIKSPKSVFFKADRNIVALKKSKSEFPVEINLSPLSTSEGLMTLASVLDITARKKAEARFQMMVESAPNAMILVNDKGIIKLANKEAATLFKYKAEEIAGKHLTALIPDRFKDSHLKHKNNYFTLPSARAMGAGRDLYAIKKDGTEFPVEIGLNPIDAEGENVVIASIIDITERKAQETIINKQLIALRIRNKEMEQFNYIASHDLQEPLRTVTNYINLLEEEYSDELNDEVKESLKNIGDAVSRMTILVRSLLDYGRLGKHKKLVVTDTESIIRNVISDLNNLVIDSSAAITYNNLPVISAYETELRQLFQNLINNAIKFRKKSISPVINVSCENTGDGYTFSISDNGIGIKEKYFERIFNMFQRLNKEEDYGGYGIGLANCKKIVDIHGGRIWAESEFGVGTTIKFTIPKLDDGKAIELYNAD